MIRSQSWAERRSSVTPLESLATCTMLEAQITPQGTMSVAIKCLTDLALKDRTVRLQEEEGLLRRKSAAVRLDS